MPGIKFKYVVIQFSTRTKTEKGLLWLTINRCSLSTGHANCYVDIKCRVRTSFSRDHREGSVPSTLKGRHYMGAMFTLRKNVKHLCYSHMPQKTTNYIEIKFWIN